VEGEEGESGDNRGGGACGEDSDGEPPSCCARMRCWLTLMPADAEDAAGLRSGRSDCCSWIRRLVGVWPATKEARGAGRGAAVDAAEAEKEAACPLLPSSGVSPRLLRAAVVACWDERAFVLLCCTGGDADATACARCSLRMRVCSSLLPAGSGLCGEGVKAEVEETNGKS
jgi:hypothetical protein